MKDIISKKLLEYGRLTDKVTYHSYGSFFEERQNEAIEKRMGPIVVQVGSDNRGPRGPTTLWDPAGGE